MYFRSWPSVQILNLKINQLCYTHIKVKVKDKVLNGKTQFSRDKVAKSHGCQVKWVLHINKQDG